MKLPFSSNSSTGGAAIAFWSARTDVGRCNTQAWPRLSIETLDTWPQTHLLGSFAQLASASNFGISRGLWAARDASHAPCSRMTATAVKTERDIVIMECLPRLVCSYGFAA